MAQAQEQPHLSMQPLAGQVALREAPTRPAVVGPYPSALPGSAASAQADETVRHPARSGSVSDDTLSAKKLEELTSQMRAHVQETRDATASLRRTLEQQQWQYQRSVSDFQLKMEEASRKKSNAGAQRIEIAPDSLQLLKSMISPSCVPTDNSSPILGAGSSSNAQALRQWFDQVESNLRRLLQSAGSKAEAKKHLQTTSLIIHNLVTNPTQERYREVNTSSARVRETFGGSEGGAAELLQLAGFERRDQAFVFPADKDFDAAERVCDILQDALRDCDKRWEQASSGVDTGTGAEAAGTGGNGAGGCVASSGAEAAGSRSEPGMPSSGSQPAGLQSAPSPASPSRRGPPEESHDAAPPWMSRTPWSSSAGRAGPSAQGAGAAGASSSSCSNGAAGPSPGAASGSGPAEPAKSSAPWFSSVVQKQLSQMPPAAGGARGSAGGDEEARGSAAPPGQGSLPAAAHPAEAREGSQEPQSGG